MNAFWLCLMILCLAAVAHSYFLYPLWWMAWRGRLPVVAFQESSNDRLPSLTVIIAAYNEAEFIHQRVRNLLELDYPSELLQIIIASDGSDDGTELIAKEAAKGDCRVSVLGFTERRGKVSVLNDVCEKAEAEILIFSDANVDFAPDALRHLVKPFMNSDVACVCGKLCFRSRPGQAHAESEGFYWKMETWLKEMEGSRGVLLGANGAIYALRRSLWRECPKDTVVEDFYIPMRLLMEKWRVLFEPKAIALEDLPPALKDEFGRRVRIGAGDYQALWRCLPLLHPRFGLAAWVFLSHKVLRWIGPFFLLGAFVSSIVLSFHGSFIGTTLLLLQSAFYAAASVGLLMPVGRGKVFKWVGLCTHFTSMNAALFLGFFRWLRRGQSTAWQRTRR